MLIMGNESSGIPEWVINKVKELLPETITVSIPQYSVLRSMNVAMAANIVMYEIRNKMENK
jgi:tRNA(Leu) C34 or U34 (ribose-2'-O)-methylase TrmL